ncbi:MAG: hypothetical protein JWR75_1145 [Devosia sp.]|nr:hypothetical protein [Devosia sp.]
MVAESTSDADARIDLAAVIGAVVRRLPRIVLVTLLLLGATYGVLQFYPKLYESSASILIEPRDNVYSRAANEQPIAVAVDPTVVSSQIELLKSRDTLIKVIEELDLKSEPEFAGVSTGPIDIIMRLLGRKPSAANVESSVLGNLLERMTVIQERDSRIISVYIRSENPDLAARIANAVAKAHVARRAELSLIDTLTSSEWLETEIDKLRIRVSAAEGAVAQFRIANDLYTGTNNSTLLDQQLSGLSTQVSAAEERRGNAETRADLIRKLIDQGQSIEGLPDVRDSIVIQQLSQAKATLQGERAQAAATLLSSHPTILALDAQITELARQIAIEGRSVAAALDAEAQIEAASVVSLQSDFSTLKLSSAAAQTQSVQLAELEREATAERELLESYLLRYRDAVSRSDSNSALPDVRVVTLAAPSMTVASPKTSMVLTAVGLAAITLQIGAIIFGELMSGRALTTVSRFERQAPEIADVQTVVPVVEMPAASASVRPAFDALDRFEIAPAEAMDDTPDVELETPAPVVIVPVAEPDIAALAAVSVAMAAVEAESAAEIAANAEVEIEAEAEAAFEADTEAEPIVDDRVHFPTPESLGRLASDLALGRVRVLMLAALGSPSEAEAVADALVENALSKGLSICCVDAGSGKVSSELGLTDLSAGEAGYGEIVQKGGREGYAEVSWGQLAAIDRQSSKPLTLVDALTDIYEVVIVLTGKLGAGSSLSLFSGLDARVALVSTDTPDSDMLAAVAGEIADLGFEQAQLVTPPMARAEVA